ncbi:MAG: hypothetical protein ACK5TN_03155 [Acidobacteriota bacterium]
MAGVEIRAACDSDPARQTTYATAALMLNHEFSDFVNIATRPDTHLDLLALALPRGIPAVVQNSLPPDLGTTRELLRLAGALPALLHENWRWQPWQARSGQPFAYHFTTMNNDGLRPAPHSQQPCFARMSRLLIDESLIHPIDCAIAHLGPLHIVFASHRRRRPGHAAALAPGRLPWHL